MPTVPEVPALPIAYVRALQILREPEAGIGELACIGNDDPAFAAVLLRLANSVESSPISRVGTVRDAIVRLGAKESRRAIIGVTLRQAFRGVSGSHINERELWRHLVSVGMLGDEIAWGRVNYSEAFTTGLLHDIGRLAMAAADPRRYGQVVLAARTTGDIEGYERRAFGVAHDEWGGEIARRWGMPDDIVDAIVEHHHGESSGLAWVVHAARQQSAGMGIGDGVQPGGPPGEEAFGSSSVLRRIDDFADTIRRAA